MIWPLSTARNGASLHALRRIAMHMEATVTPAGLCCPADLHCLIPAGTAASGWRCTTTGATSGRTTHRACGSHPGVGRKQHRWPLLRRMPCPAHMSSRMIHMPHTTGAILDLSALVAIDDAIPAAAAEWRNRRHPMAAAGGSLTCCAAAACPEPPPASRVRFQVRASSIGCGGPV